MRNRYYLPPSAKVMAASNIACLDAHYCHLFFNDEHEDPI
jgi:hypothetical protein